MSTDSFVETSHKSVCKLLPVDTLGKRLAAARERAGISQAELARQAGIRQQSVQAIENGRVRSSAHTLKFAHTLGVRPEWLDSGRGEMFLEEEQAENPQAIGERRASPQRQPEVLPTIAPSFGPDEVPIYGYAAGSSDDSLNLANGAEVGRVPRHPSQRGMPRAFAVYVIGESMMPRYRPGEIVYVIPGRMPNKGEDAVIEFLNGDGYVKEFQGRTETEVVCWQHNPPSEWRRPLERVKAIHSIGGTTRS